MDTAAQICAQSTRPSGRLPASDYANLGMELSQHLEARYGSTLPSDVVREIVAVTVAEFVARCLLTHATQGEPSPKELLRALDDAVLDYFIDREVGPSSQQWNQVVVNDRTWVWSVLGHDELAYQDALHEVRVEGSRKEFVVVSQYMAQRETSRTAPSWNDVAEQLPHLGMSGGDVERLMFRFASRLRRWP